MIIKHFDFAQEAISHVHSAPVLIIDDNDISRIFVEETLRKNGFSNLLSVASAAEGLGAFDSFHPELVILDILMPTMNGFECCEEIRKNPTFRDLPILIQTVITEPELRVKAFRCGATDFVSKPVYPDELCARVLVHLQNRLYVKSLRLYKQRVQSELDTARKLQSSILPNAADIDTIRKQAALEIAAYFEPASEIGGDFWGSKLLPSGEVSLWAADFSGHGVASALNSFRLQAHMKEDCDGLDNPGEYLSILSNKLKQLLPRGQFATMFYGVINNQQNLLKYACACTPNPIIYRAVTKKAEFVDGSGELLAVSKQPYSTQHITFEKGDVFLLYSDALIETPDESGNYFTETELLADMAALAGKSAAEICDTLTKQFMNRCGGVQVDDLTIVVIRRI